MKRTLRRAALTLTLGAAFGIGLAQEPGAQPPLTGGADRPDVRLPNGKLQRDEILKAEHEQNLKDAAKLVELADDLKQTLEKEDRYVFSLTTVKKTEDIEKLVRKIRTRLRHD
ncbi:MAG TPA: hypothetical protein VLY24_05765 [Bryobacteraceae bacterium]|nr:hypothetical protein [Bryobacteraceae bacterium]